MKWKRTMGWLLIGCLALLLVAVVGGYLYLRSSNFRQYALRKIVGQADSATGGRTEIGGLDFSLSTLTAHLYNITLRGNEAAGNPPLLQADKLTVRVKILSALHRQVSLRELLIDHPVVHVEVSRDGKNNLPAPPPSQNSSQSSVFDLGVQHAQITNGEIDYNDQKIPIEANLYDLGTDIRFVPLIKTYKGNVSYNNGNVNYAQYAALPHSLTVKFSASPQKFELQSALMKLGASAIAFHAQVSDYSNPVADGEYQIRIHAQDFADLSPQAAPKGDLALSGKIHYAAADSGPLLRSIAVDGHFASEVLTAVTSGKRVEINKLKGNYRLSGGNLNVGNIALETMGGSITGDAEVSHIDTTPESRLQASLHNISLGAIQRSFTTRDIRGAVIYGTLDGTAEASWKGSLRTLRAQSDLTVRGAASQTVKRETNVPVQGAIHASYDGAHQTVILRDTNLRIPSATLNAQGTIGNQSILQLNVVANDLHELTALADSLGLATPLPAISGSATLNALVRGSLQKPAIAAQLNAQNLQVEGSEWKSASFQMNANPSQFVVQSGSLINAHRGRATVTGSVGLDDWSYKPWNRIEAHLDVQQMSIVDLQQLAKQNYPVSGDLSAKVMLGGSQLDPSGSGSAQITNARAYNEPIQDLKAQFTATKGSIDSTLKVSAAAGTIDAKLSYVPKTKGYKIYVEAPALVLQKLQTVQAKNIQLTGSVSASLKGEGTLDDPQLDATLQLPQLDIRQSSITGLKADVHIAQHVADLNVDSKASQASVHAHGRVALSGDYYTEAVIDTNTVPLDVLMATYAPSVPQGFKGQTEMHATLKGSLKDKSKLEAHLTIPVLKASYQSLEIGIASPIHADYSNSVITLQPADIQGTGTSLHLQGRMPIGGTASPTLSANGSVDVRILKIVAPDVESSGTLALDVRSSGSASTPKVEGQLQLKDVSLTTADAPVGIEKLNGTLDITNDRVQVSKMTGQVGGGQVSVGGSMLYKPSFQFNLALQGQSVRLRYPEGVRSVLDANLTLSGTAEASSLNGRVLIDNLSFTPDFDLAKISDQFSTGNAPAQPGIADTIKLAIGVQSQDSLSATSSQISIAGRVNWQVGGTAADPVITGRTTLSSGELFYRNVRYELQKGVITFDNPNETHPVMNVSVTTTVEQYNLTLTLRGPLDKLTTSYVSDPPLAAADIINLVARGKTTQESAASSQSTDSMIASQAASQLSSSVQKLAGISSLQIDPTIGGNNQNPSARIALQQRVTRNLLFTFSTDVSQPGSEIVQGEYQINKRWSVSMARDQTGGVSVDGRFHTRF
jgi:translocation and assembly module TamB